MWPVLFWIASPARRAAISAVPPGAKPTITWIGCLGTQSARAEAADNTNGAANKLRRNMFEAPNPLAEGRASGVPGQGWPGQGAPLRCNRLALVSARHASRASRRRRLDTAQRLGGADARRARFPPRRAHDLLCR